LEFEYTGVVPNNGNVKAQKITPYSESGVAQPKAEQSYQYDPFNRLKTFTEGVAVSSAAACISLNVRSQAANLHGKWHWRSTVARRAADNY
jgi:hypothetical protein